MANNRNLINAFDDCIERLITGEDLDDILKDYPDSAEYLRDLLMIGERVSEIHNEDDETTSAQSRGRDKLQQVLKEKPKRISRSKIRSYGSWGVAATIAVILGIGVLMAILMPAYSVNRDIARTPLIALNSTTENLIRATQAQSTQVAYLMTTITPQGTILPSTIQPEMSAVYIPTSVASMEEATAPPPPMLVTATQAQLYAQMTATNLSDLWATTPTSERSGISAVQAAQTTATALAHVFASTPMLSGLPLTDDSRDDSLPETGGWGDSGGGSYGVEDAIKTTSFPEPMSTLLPTNTPAPTQTIVPVGTQVAAESLIIPSQSDDTSPTPLPALISLNAGEIDDNDEWDTYLLYRREFMLRGIPVYDLDVTGRQIISVVDETGQPILGARVQIFAKDILIAENLTYATGQTMFFPNADERLRGINTFVMKVEKNGVSEQFILNRNQASEWQVILPLTVNHDAVQVDVLFLMDTTSSMGDEIMQLQNNIWHISDALASFTDNIDVHYGLLLYREHDNFEYLTRRHEFTADVSEFQIYLNAVTANSGDNNPDWDETLNVGLDESLRLMSWRDENTIKLIFIVADAAPHINHPLEPITYDQSMQEALARGIKIHPIGSSGLEPQGEYIFRQIAQVTMGHFLFLTYDNGVVGTVGDSRPELDVGDPETLDPIGGYTVDRLADVVLRLIQDEILIFRGIIQP
jgi:hypothetical protein